MSIWHLWDNNVYFIWVHYILYWFDIEIKIEARHILMMKRTIFFLIFFFCLHIWCNATTGLHVSDPLGKEIRHLKGLFLFIYVFFPHLVLLGRGHCGSISECCVCSCCLVQFLLFAVLSYRLRPPMCLDLAWRHVGRFVMNTQPGVTTRPMLPLRGDILWQGRLINWNLIVIRF